MHPKKLDTGSKDLINNLPEVLIHHILSFLPIKEAASTSILSKKWRYLFAFSPNLDFDDPIRMQPDLPLQEKTEIHTTFMDFVDRILSLQGNFPVNKFSLKCGNGVEDVGITRWLCNVLERGISDLDLRLALAWPHYLFPVKVFSSKSLVKLRIGTRNGLAFGGVLVDEVEDVFLPKLKTLYLDTFEIDYENLCPLAKLLSGCPVLEELVLINLWWNHWESCSVSHSTLKRLKIFFEDVHDNPNQSVTFDTPALVYFEYSDIVARNYAKVNFESLIEARLDLKVGYEEVVVENVMGFPPDIDYVRVGDATNLFVGIRNVQILYLSASTVEVLTFCCEAIPIFNNLAHLTIESSPTVGWDSLPDLLQKCPNLKTLIFQGLHHKATDRCGDLCLCKSAENSPTCLSSSPVKVLKILKFKTTNDNETEVEQMKYFLETMPNLEQVILYYDTSSKDEDVIKVSKQLEMLPKVASPKCKIQVISDNLNLSVNIPSSISIKWDPLL